MFFILDDFVRPTPLDVSHSSPLRSAMLTPSLAPLTDFRRQPFNDNAIRSNCRVLERLRQKQRRDTVPSANTRHVNVIPATRVRGHLSLHTRTIGETGDEEPDRRKSHRLGSENILARIAVSSSAKVAGLTKEQRNGKSFWPAASWWLV